MRNFWNSHPIFSVSTSAVGFVSTPTERISVPHASTGSTPDAFADCFAAIPFVRRLSCVNCCSFINPTQSRSRSSSSFFRSCAINKRMPDIAQSIRTESFHGAFISFHSCTLSLSHCCIRFQRNPQLPCKKWQT